MTSCRERAAPMVALGTRDTCAEPVQPEELAGRG